jgi:hypothetical protein
VESDEALGSAAGRPCTGLDAARLYRLTLERGAEGGPVDGVVARDGSIGFTTIRGA